MVKNKKIRKCQFPECGELASVHLISVPGQEGEYCLLHGKQTWDEYFGAIGSLKKEGERSEK